MRILSTTNLSTAKSYLVTRSQNPFFSLVSPLLSRSLVAEFKPLAPQDLETLIRRAVADPERGLGRMKLQVDEEAVRFLAEIDGGDARRALNGLELAALTTPLDAEGFIRLSALRLAIREGEG